MNKKIQARIKMRNQEKNQLLMFKAFKLNILRQIKNLQIFKIMVLHQFQRLILYKNKFKTNSKKIKYNKIT